MSHVSSIVRVTAMVFLVAVVCGSSVAPAPGGDAKKDAKATKITVILRGAVTQECADALKQAMKSIKHIRYNEDEIQPGEKGPFGHYFTPNMTLELLDVEKTDLGEIAKVVASAKTKKRDEVPPSLNIILYIPTPFVRGDIVSLRETFGEVPGFEAREKGGTGGFPDQNTLRLRLDSSGAAKLSDVTDNLKRAKLTHTLQKE